MAEAVSTTVITVTGNQSNQAGGWAPAANGVANQGSLQAGRQNNGGVDRATPMQKYDAQLKEARSWARILGFLNAISQFLAFCNLTWATVALLGAFLPDLLVLDFAFVTALVFVEAGRLATASFFVSLLMRPLAYGSQDPKLMNHSADGQYPLSRRARVSSNVLQLILIAPSLAIPIIGQVFLDYGSTILNLQVSLRIFYGLVALNSVVAVVYLIYSALAFNSLNKPPEQSVLRYFDTVLERAMNSGIVQSDDFEFFRFAYTMLGGEFRRNVQPEAVAKNHTKLIWYMYAHRLGVDFLEIYLDADDAFVRLAAANMVGFWADRTWDVGLPELRLPEEILTKLADKVGTGQVGWAAATSFGVLAKSSPSWAHIVAETCTSSNVRLLARLVQLVDESSSRSLSLVRTLVQFYEQLSVNEQQRPDPSPFGDGHTILVAKLEKLAREAKVQRLRVQAAYLLLLLAGERFNSEVVKAIKPYTDNYWFTSEVDMLKLLHRNVTHRNADDVPLLELPQVRKDASIKPPPWAKPWEGAA